MGKTIQAISLILKNRHDEITAPVAGHAIYESKGVLKLRNDAEKERLKAERLAKRQAAKALREREKRHKARRKRGEPSDTEDDGAETDEDEPKAATPSASSSPAGRKPPGGVAALSTTAGAGGAPASAPSLRIALHRPGAASGVPRRATGAAGSALDDPVAAAVTAALRDGKGPVQTRFGLDPAAPSEYTYQSRAATADDVAEAVRKDKEEADAGVRPGRGSAAEGGGMEPALPRLALKAPRGPASHATLVVCPVVAIPHWQKEIESRTAPGTLRVHVHHGPKRTTDVAELLRADVVITSYSVVEAEFRKMIAPSKVTCDYCGRVFMPEKLRTHLKYFCGPDAVLTEAQAKQERGEGSELKGWVRSMLKRRGVDVDALGGKGGKAGQGGKAGKGAGSPAGKASAKGGDDALAAALGEQDGDGSDREGQEEEGSDAEEEATWTGAGRGSRKGAAKAKAVPAKRGRKAASPKAAAAASARPSKDSKGEDQDDDVFAPDSDDEDDEDDDEDDDDDEGEDEEAASSSSSSSAAVAPAPKAKKRSAKPPGLGPVSVLQKIFWRRVVLDEAHAIKNLASATARAILALTAERRWCLSGTPLQNRAGELNALVRFLRVDPFAFYFCSGCPCKSMEYLFRGGVRKCPQCGCSPMRHYSWLGRYVTNPIRYRPGTPAAAEGMRRLRARILPAMLLRRTKAGRSGDMALPCRLVRLRKDRLDKFEDDFYSALYTQSQAQFDRYVGKGTLLNNYAHIFGLLMRLRQAVDHPYLVLYSQTQANQAAGSAAAAAASDGAGGACALCGEAVERPVTGKCGHVFCRECVTSYLQSFDSGGAEEGIDKEEDRPTKRARPGTDGEGDEEEEEEQEDEDEEEEAGPVVAKCPSCLAPLSVDLSASASADADAPPTGRGRQGILSRVPPSQLGAGFRSSTKIEALLQELSRAQDEEPGCKSIVFSQFTSMLDLVEHRLTHAGVRCVKLDGRMSVKARDRIITAFGEDPSILVFLISLKAGGVALNLTAASRTFLMDPWWNPAAEEQALDRTHRLGQHRPITAVRLVIAGSIEERILKLQEKKKLVFEGTIGQDSQALARLTEADMRFLFSG